MEKQKQPFWTVPNILSLIRIGLAPVFLWCFFSDLPHAWMWAMAVFLTAGITDLLDGWLARRFHQISLAGRVLDPLADKLMMACALCALAVSQVLPVWLAVLYVVKEVCQGVFGLILMGRTRDMPPSNWLGKAGTFLFYVTVVTLSLFQPPILLKNTLLILSFGTIFAALCSYLLRVVQQGLLKKSEE